MKKIISLAILSLILIHLIGFYAYFVVRQLQISSEMREAISSLPTDRFEVFELTFEEYSKVKVNDHEVNIDGRMYDHSTPKIENGKVKLFAKHDLAEDNLLEFISEVVNRHTHDSKPIPSELSNFFNLQFLATIPLQISLNLIQKRQFGSLLTNVISTFYPVESPPPRL